MLPEVVLISAIRADFWQPQKNEWKAELIKYWHQRAVLDRMNITDVHTTMLRSFYSDAKKNNKKCRSSSSLSHFLFPRDFSGIITNRDIINTPLEPLGPADVPSGGFVDIAPYFGGGWNPPKTPIFGPWIGVFKPNVQNIESFMLSKHLHRFRLNFCTTTETVKWSSWVVPIGAQHIQDGGRPPFWKHR